MSNQHLHNDIRYETSLLNITLNIPKNLLNASKLKEMGYVEYDVDPSLLGDSIVNTKDGDYIAVYVGDKDFIYGTKFDRPLGNIHDVENLKLLVSDELKREYLKALPRTYPKDESS